MAIQRADNRPMKPPGKIDMQDPRKCPLNAFQNAAGGKYKMRILWELVAGPQRYGELRRSALVSAMGKPVTARVLSRELKELQSRGLIHRKQYPVVPPKVEYSLTDLGKSLVPVIREIVHWGLTGGHATVINSAVVGKV
jgi:DNA-binding HxlR family transcriptional regulator